MEYTELPVKEKMISNETLAKVTRSSHFNPPKGGGGVSGPNGFRSPMLPPHLNGKTNSSSLSHQGSRASNSEPQPRRSVITLKSAPGPPVNSSGTGVLKTKSCSTTTAALERLGSDAKGGRGGRSRKRSREGEAEPGDDKRDASSNGAAAGATESTSASENVESTRRRRRGQSSKRLDKKNGHLPPVADLSPSKLKVSSNSASAATGILDMYRLSSKPVDISRFMVNVAALDILLSDDSEVKEAAAAAEDDAEARLVIEEINNVMQLLPKQTFVQRPFVENALNEEAAKVRLMLDLERPSQADDDDRLLHRSGSLDKTKSRSFELFPAFALDDLPLYSSDEFAARLKLPVCDSLDTLISFSKPTDHGTEKNSRYEGIPPSPFSFSPCGVSDYNRAVRSGRTGERPWIKTESASTSKTKLEPKIELPDPKTGAGVVRLKEEQDDEASGSRDRSRDLENIRFPVHPDLPSLQLKRDDDEGSHTRRSLSNLPAMPCSPGVQAATILCTMANSDDKEFAVKGKRQQNSEPTHSRIAKLAKLDEKPSSLTLRESTGPAVKKSPMSSEKKRSLSQVNHSLSSAAAAAKRPQHPLNSQETGSARAAGGSNHKTAEEHRESGRHGSTARAGSSATGLKSKEGSSGHSGKVNGLTNSSAAKSSPSSLRRESNTGLTTVSRSRCFVPSEPAGVGSSVVGPRTTVSIKSSSSRRSSFEAKPRSKHGSGSSGKVSSRD